MSADLLIDRLRSHCWRGQIIGPHGSGKSTLATELTHHLARAGRPAAMFALRDGQHRLPAGWRRRAAEGRACTLVIDGYEQLSRFSRWRLKRFARQLKCGLLVTAHTDVGLPTIYQTQPDLPLALRVAARLQPDGPRVTEDDVRRAFLHQEGNLRETLFDLYDLYETKLAAHH